ncbi:hypothetical protein BAR24_02345 [Gluconobacter oxydans]|uniref:hypothetical protein n=1 Tax=Gluconobacter thailandicus TaxID=257438 RepID=UPI0002996915|nr:hypothetical protein [Gluconobacter thailandicus]AFW00934.1 hypothetical protein B932_1352 [Gluconobacter oxydans H24]ANQ40405.1 hypothetical protein BAR24_02345 [Gluconobacter oxydans]
MRLLSSTSVCLLGLGLMGSLAAAPATHGPAQLAPVKPVAGKEDGTISVTSDSAEYCTQLTQSVDHLLATPHGIPVGAMDDARRLRTEGDTLCRHRHLRAGIARLRRALVLIEHSQEHS